MLFVYIVTTCGPGKWLGFCVGVQGPDDLLIFFNLKSGEYIMPLCLRLITNFHDKMAA